MHGTKVSDLIAISGDIHHIFPRAYLKKNGVDSKTKYNQVANYIYLDTQVNKAISDSAPCDYFKRAISAMWIQGALFWKYHRYHRIKDEFGGELYPSNDRRDGRLELWHLFNGATEVNGGNDETVL